MMPRLQSPADSPEHDRTPQEHADLTRIYNRRFDETGDYRNRVWETLCSRFFQRWVPRDASVLDLGCGYGVFINHIDCREKTAMDLNPASGARLRSGVRFLEQDCSRPWAVPGDSLDVVFSSNFFEHLPSKDALAATIAEAHRCLKPGGALLALGPNIRYIPGAYWDFWDHYIPLTERSLKEALEIRGFHVEVCVDRFLPYTMVDRRPPPLALVALYLKLPYLWKFFGKQFFLVARKTASAGA